MWLGTPPYVSQNSRVERGVAASAPIKIILFGERVIVYGKLAIAITMDKRVYAKAELS